jgi:hypothetical protein
LCLIPGPQGVPGDNIRMATGAIPAGWCGFGINGQNVTYTTEFR